MKQILLTLTGFIALTALFAQNLTLSNEYGNLSAGDTIFVFPANNEATEVHVYVTNGGAIDIDVKVKKQNIELLPGAFSTYCWGQCFSPTVFESPYSVTIGAGQTNSTSFYSDYNANGSDGITLVRYTFFDTLVPSDSVDVYIQFFSSPTSVGDNPILKTELSNPYPNPASSKCQFNYSIPYDIMDAKIVLMDLTGNIAQTVVLAPGEGKATMDVSALPSGIYFYSLWINEKPLSTRKLIIQK